jgi:ferredoxin-NADP reductase
MLGKKFRAVFAGKRQEAEGIATFSFRPAEKIEFRAGQFAFFSFKLGGRHYSKHFTISSPPESGLVEFTTIISDSDYKQALNRLGQGAEAEITKPGGFFTLDSRKSNKVAFLAGGIGITPVKSVLESMAESEGPKGLEIAVFCSNRNKARVVFRERLGQLAEKIGNVKIVHTLTEPDESEKKAWNGETGFINAEMLKRHTGGTGEWAFFVSGPPAFNSAMGKILRKELNVKKEMIITEDFLGY